MAEEKKDPAKPTKKLTEQEIISAYKMVKGDYRVKVRIYEANDLIPAKAGGLAAVTNMFGKSAADPMVRVELHGQKKYTKPKKKTLSPLFNEVFFFRLKNLDKEQLETMTIKFTVLDKNSWAVKDSIMGAYELDITSVYFSLNHELFQIWLTLTDPTDTREGIMGYLKVSLECLGPEDEPNVHDVTTDKNPDLAKEKSFFSSKVKQEGHVVEMQVYRAEALAPMDDYKPEVDAYVMCKYSGIKNKSKQVTSKNPEWNQKVTLGCMLPNQSKFIQVEVWDYDLIGSDDLVGNFKVPFVKIREKELTPRWGNLYGAPLSAKDNKEAELMTLYGQDLGSTYRGRIFYGMTSFNYGDPKSETKDLLFKFPMDPIPQSPQRTYLLRVDILEGHELPDKERAIVHVAMGPYMIKTTGIKIDGGRALWYEALPDKKVVFPCEKDEIPDIIFYFADADEENRRHCFFRIKAADVLVEKDDMEGIGKPRVIKLKEDRALNLLSDDEFPGFLFVKVNLFCVNPPIRLPLERNIKTQDYELRVHLYVGRDLPPADEGGVSDPFIIVRCAGNIIQSKVKQQTLNPGWYETLTMDVTLPEFEKDHVPSGMMVALYDADDDEGKKRDLLGRTWITFQDNFVNYKITKGDSTNEMVEMIYKKPKWWNVIYDGVDDVQGKLLLGYVLIKKEDAFKVPFEPLYPECTKEKLHIFVIGLRDIEQTHSSLSKMKLKALSASFDISGDDFDPVVTVPEKIYNNGVNINTYLPINVDVPKNKNLCPVLDVFAYDHSNSSNDISVKNLLGLSTINLSKYLTKYYMTAEERAEYEEAKEAENAVEQLKKDAETAMGGAKVILGTNYQDLQDDELFRHIGWELPRHRKILPDEEFRKKKKEEEEIKSTILVNSGASKKKPIKSPIQKNQDGPLHFIEPHKLVLQDSQEDEEDNEISERGIENKPLIDPREEEFKYEQRVEEEHNYEPVGGLAPIIKKKNNKEIIEEGIQGTHNNQLGKNFKMAEKNMPKKFYDEEVTDNNEEIFQLNSNQQILLGPNRSEPKKIEVANRKDKPLETNKLLLEFNEENSLQNEQKSVSNEHPSKKNIRVFRPPPLPKDDDPEVGVLEQANHEKKQEILKPLDLDSKKNSVKPGSMILDLSPIAEHPLEDTKLNKQLIETLKVTSKMSISEASKISSGALSARDLPEDNLKLTTKPKVMKMDDPGAFGKLKLFSKNLSKKLLNKIKKNEEHYEDYDSIDGEDYDMTPEYMKDREKHHDDLEDIIPMDKYIKRFSVMRGQTRGKSSAFQTDKGEGMEKIALLKCIFIEGKGDETPEAALLLENKIKVLKDLMRPLDYIARVYILSGKDIQPLDDGKPNPYIKIEMGNKSHDYKVETLNKETFQPEFYKCYEYPVKIPGSAFMRIEVWDGKTGLGDEDEMIGYTEIDLEDRHFTGEWRILPKKPVEMRNLKSDIIQGSQGRLELWAELIPMKDKTLFPKINVFPPPKYKFELRTIVWGTQDCVFKDELEKCNDLYVRGGPANLEAYETDVHWRCRAKGSFNWRWKFPVSYPPRTEDDYGADRFKVSLWDKDIITADELLGETDVDLNIHKMIEKACKRAKPVKMQRRVLERAGEITDRLWFDVFHPEALDFTGKPLSQGKVQMSFELVPEKDSEKRKNGFGRESPNLFPTLPDPVGRFKFDFLNPLGMCKELLGPTIYAKIWKVICSIICTAFLIYLLYIIATQGIAVAVVG